MTRLNWPTSWKRPWVLTVIWKAPPDEVDLDLDLEPEPESEREEAYSLNDAGRAQRFVDRFQEDIRYVPKFRCWLLWGEQRWRRDEDGGVIRRAIEHSRILVTAANAQTNSFTRAAALEEAVSLGDARVIRQMLDLARVDRRIIAPHDALDADPFLLGVRNGVVDLRTGLFRPGLREDDARPSDRKLGAQDGGLVHLHRLTGHVLRA